MDNNIDTTFELTTSFPDESLTKGRRGTVEKAVMASDDGGATQHWGILVRWEAHAIRRSPSDTGRVMVHRRADPFSKEEMSYLKEVEPGTAGEYIPLRF